MKKLLLATALLSIVSIGFGQNTLRTSLHFEVNQTLLTEQQQQQLSSFISNIDADRIKRIHIFGHTDSVGSIDYNLRLSEKRSLAAMDYLFTKNIPANTIRMHANGESKPTASNKSPEGRQSNRRTNIVVQLNPIIQSTAELPADTIVPAPEPCQKDTTFTLPQGTVVTMNACDLSKIKDCFSLEEYNNGASLQQSNVTTMTREGQPLISGGMFNITLCEGVCATIRLPVRRDCTNNRIMSPWRMNRNGTWTRTPRQQLKLVKVDGKEFHEVNMCRSGGFNCDAYVLNPPKIKVVTKNNLHLIEAKLSFDCPPAMMVASSEKERGKKAIFRAFCPRSEPMLYAKVVNKKGDTLVMDFRPAKEVDKREMFGRCTKRKVIKKVVFFNVHEKSIYRKYMLKEDNFRVVHAEK